MSKLSTGQINLATGLGGLTLFMLYGFGLIYMRDFGPDHVQWAADYSNGTHFEARLAHVHGALFSVLNVVMGLVLRHLAISEQSRSRIGALTLMGLLMPLGIVAEFAVGAPPVFVVVGALAITVAFGWATVAALKSPQKN